MTGQMGMALPDAEVNRRRWAEAAPKVAMALCEAGYPTRFQPVGVVLGPPPSIRENELIFDRWPPDEVLLKAAGLCGVRDLVEEGIERGGVPREGDRDG